MLLYKKNILKKSIKLSVLAYNRILYIDKPKILHNNSKAKRTI